MCQELFPDFKVTSPVAPYDLRPYTATMMTSATAISEALHTVLEEPGASIELKGLAETNLFLGGDPRISAEQLVPAKIGPVWLGPHDRTGRVCFDLLDRLSEYAESSVYRVYPRNTTVLPTDVLSAETQEVICAVDSESGQARRGGDAYFAKMGDLFETRISRSALSREWQQSTDLALINYEDYLAQGRGAAYMVMDMDASLPLREENVLGPSEGEPRPMLSERQLNRLLIGKCCSKKAHEVVVSGRWGPSMEIPSTYTRVTVLPQSTTAGDSPDGGYSAGDSGLECPTCYTDFAQDDQHAPRIFPCGHSICQGCMEMLLKTTYSHQTIKCPTCRQSTTVVESLPRNFALVSLMQQLTSTRAKTPTSRSKRAGPRKAPLTPTPFARLAWDKRINGRLFARLKLQSICLRAAERNLQSLSEGGPVMSYKEILEDALSKARCETRNSLVPELGPSAQLRACLVAHIEHCLELITPSSMPPVEESIFGEFCNDGELCKLRFLTVESRVRRSLRRSGVLEGEPPAMASSVSSMWGAAFNAFLEAHNRNQQRMHELCSDPVLSVKTGYCGLKETVCRSIDTAAMPKGMMQRCNHFSHKLLSLAKLSHLVEEKEEDHTLSNTPRGQQEEERGSACREWTATPSAVNDD